MNTSPLIAPSLLSADFANLERDIRMLNKSNCDWYHLDVMDGVFVPNISFGFPVMQAMARVAEKPLDVHLMIVEPEKFVPQVKALGARVMNVHQEATIHLHRLLNQIRKEGMMSGVTLNPSTPVCMVEDVLQEADVVMLMSVNPGFAGQKFIDETVEKVKRLREMIDRRNLNTLIEIDGGVSRDNAQMLVEAGVDVLVAGSAVFKAADPKKEIDILKGDR
ncbi:MAG: ribulose-phosphate 3-epimerase [Bacteroidaceae bacterium]|nr:ribulose-phosphate 3-epimerase [Bacteroidaceae bacterium]MBR3733988.1 ribulose-phosphate 3-epimerase [Bacteroidaceae bacterium]MBR4648992.1 ribulose-phosphate 3-epimerase [Bacteroidaceae bacterium]MBR6713787.1 ribulose-phosphate 3-epimerase [Bacteroidaceae bacterium]